MLSAISQRLARRVRQARRQRRLKQETVARYLNVSISAVCGMERGSRRIDAAELFCLSKLFDLPLEWFFAVESPGERMQTSSATVRHPECED